MLENIIIDLHSVTEPQLVRLEHLPLKLFRQDSGPSTRISGTLSGQLVPCHSFSRLHALQEAKKDLMMPVP